MRSEEEDEDEDPPGPIHTRIHMHPSFCVHPQALKYTQNAMMSAQHLMNLVNDILDISKIEAGKLELDKRIFSLHECLHAAVEIVKESLAVWSYGSLVV